MIRLTTTYLWNLITKNPLKIIYIILAFVSYNYIGTFKTVKEKTEIVDTVTINNRDYNVFNKSTTGDEDYNVYEVNKTDKIEVINGVKYVVNYRGDYLENTIIAVFFTMIGFLIICFFYDLIAGNINDKDQETWFGFSEIMSETLVNMVKCSLENNIYYYTIFGRLIYKSEKETDRYNSQLPLLKLTSLRRYPKFKTPSEKRDFFIDKIIG